MGIIIGDKECRNLQEQVQKNKEDIEELQSKGEIPQYVKRISLSGTTTSDSRRLGVVNIINGEMHTEHWDLLLSNVRYIWEEDDVIHIQLKDDEEEIIIDKSELTTVAWNNITSKPFNELGDSLKVVDDKLETDIQNDEILAKVKGSKFISVDENEDEEVEVSFDFTEMNDFIHFPTNQNQVVLSWKEASGEYVLSAELSDYYKNKLDNSLQQVSDPLTTEPLLVSLDVDGKQKNLKLSDAFTIEDGVLDVVGGGGGASSWDDLTGKPFDTIGDGLYVTDDKKLSADLSAYRKSVDQDVIDQDLEDDITALNNNKVDKVIGKGLSSNDFTDAQKTKLANLSNYDDTEVKGDIQQLRESKVNIEAGKGLSTNDLTNTLLASLRDKYTKDEVASLMASARAIKVVASLPTPTVPNTMYYVGSASPYHVYLYDSDNHRIDLGSSEIDFTIYQHKEDNNLETTSKKVVGAINELNDALDDKEDRLPPKVNDKYLHVNGTTGTLEWAEAGGGGGGTYVGGIEKFDASTITEDAFIDLLLSLHDGDLINLTYGTLTSSVNFINGLMYVAVSSTQVILYSAGAWYRKDDNSRYWHLQRLVFEKSNMKASPQTYYINGTSYGTSGCVPIATAISSGYCNGFIIRITPYEAPYTELQYIQTNDANSYINTNKNLVLSTTGKTKMQLDFESNDGNYWFGVLQDQNFIGYGYSASEARIYTGSSGYTTVSLSRNVRHTFVIDFEIGRIIVDDIATAFTKSNKTYTIPMYVFSRNQNGSFLGGAKMKLYNFKLWDNSGNLIMDLIPVRRTSDSIICTYDKVSHQFFLNSGTGNFIAGPDKN